MSEIADKCRKRYVDGPICESKVCLIHGPEHSSDECKVLVHLCSEDVKVNPTKDYRNHPLPINKFNIQKENIAIVNSAGDEILLHENRKVSAAKEAPENIESYFDDNGLYQIENMSLGDIK